MTDTHTQPTVKFRYEETVEVNEAMCKLKKIKEKYDRVETRLDSLAYNWDRIFLDIYDEILDTLINLVISRIFDMSPPETISGINNLHDYLRLMKTEGDRNPHYPEELKRLKAAIFEVIRSLDPEDQFVLLAYCLDFASRFDILYDWTFEEVPEAILESKEIIVFNTLKEPILERIPAFAPQD
ncbi:MAG: hypothetical protein ACR2HF_08025 [Methylococcaceae bacterium]